MKDSSFPIIASVAEVTQMTCGSNRMSAMMDHDGILYVVGTEGRACHVVPYPYKSTQSPQKKSSLLFHREVEAAEFVMQNDSTILLILTRDGRMWRCCPQTLKPGTWPHSRVVTEIECQHRLLGIKFLASGKNGVVAAGSTLLGPPQVLWLDNDMKNIPGLEHIQSPITSVLFVFRDRVAPALWRAVTQFIRGNVESAVFLGFADGAIRMSLVMDSRSVRPVQLIGYVDSIRQEVMTILAIPGTPLIDMLCFVGKNGAVAIWNDASFFHNVDGIGSGRWTSATVLVLDCRSNSTTSPQVCPNRRRYLLATRNDGSTHVLLLTNDSFGLISVCERFPVQDEMAFVTCCVSSQSSWLVFGTFDGSAVIMHVDASSFDKILLWESETQSTDILDTVREQPQDALVNSHTRRLLRRLRSFEQKNGGASLGPNESISQHYADIQSAKETTEVVLGLIHRRSTKVVISEESDSISVSSVAALPQPTSGKLWTSSLHACFGSELYSASRTAVACRRLCHNNLVEVDVHYGGVAVTESRAVGKDIEYRIEINGSKPIETFFSLSVERDVRAVRLESSRDQSKRRKNNVTVDSSVLCARSEAGDFGEALVLPL